MLQLKENFPMESFKSLINAFFQFPAYVMLPLIILVIALIIRMKFKDALISSLKLAAGFAGIFIAFAFFVENINPAVQALTQVRGLDLPILDVGWPPLAAITWASPLAHISIPMIILINAIMLSTNLTKTIYIDIWNYWHFAMLGTFILSSSQSMFLGLFATALVAIYAIKMSDWTGPLLVREMGLKGLTLSPLSTLGLLPYANGMDALLERIPGIKKLSFNPSRQGEDKKTTLLAEPMVIGFIVGVLLGIAAAYAFKEILELGVHIAAVMFILPKCGSLIGEGMGAVSTKLRNVIQHRFPKKTGLLVALDVGIVMHNKSILTTGIILMPLAIALSLVIPGNKTLPLGDLPTLIAQVSVIVLVCRGNVIRSVLLGIPLVIGYLLIATAMAPLITTLAHQVGAYAPEGVLITALTDGGNPIRYWGLMLFKGNIVALTLIPVMIVLLIISRNRYHAQIKEQA